MANLQPLAMIGQLPLLTLLIGQDWKDNLQGKQGEPQPPPGIFTLGGTLVEGPGCPAVCGSFVFCKEDRRSRNNLQFGYSSTGVDEKKCDVLCLCFMPGKGSSTALCGTWKCS